MLDVQQRDSNVRLILAEHEIPELLRSADVEDFNVALKGSQQRQEKLESATPHPGRERSGVTIVGKTPDE
jgi:hypothetical protein